MRCFTTRQLNVSWAYILAFTTLFNLGRHQVRAEHYGILGRVRFQNGAGQSPELIRGHFYLSPESVPIPSEAEGEGESMSQPDRVANDPGWISMSFVGSHAARLYWTEIN